MKKKLVYEVSIIRPLIILILVIFHSFCIYGGKWEPIPSINTIPVYYWFSNLIFGFCLETFVLISGYIYAFQQIELNKKYNLTNIVRNKFKHLIIPCWFFGLLYYLLITRSNGNIDNPLLYIFNGAGHLWFLPMLFWCFIFLHLIIHTKIDKRIIFIILSIVSIIPIPSITMHFGLIRVPHFLFFFYSGYILWIYKDKICTHFLKLKWIILFASLHFLLIYLDCNLYDLNHDKHNATIYLKLLHRGMNYFIPLLGNIALFLTIYLFTFKKQIRLPKWIIESGKLCFGIYIFHQFVIKYLYYQTNLPELAGSYMLPLISVVLSLSISIILTKILIQTKIGKLLLG